MLPHWLNSLLGRKTERRLSQQPPTTCRQPVRPQVEELEGRLALIAGGNTDALNLSAAIGQVSCSAGSGTGTLIAPRYVLTAAHVVVRAGSLYVPPDVTFQTASTSTRAGITYAVERVYLHPDFEASFVSRVSSKPDFNDDLAILKLRDEVPAEVAQPIDINRDPVPEYTPIYRVGYGGPGGRNWAQDWYDDIQSETLDSSHGDGVFTENGDSGGPGLWAKVVNTPQGPRQRLEIAGIVSGATIGFPDVWVMHDVDCRVDAKASWIDSITGVNAGARSALNLPDGSDVLGSVSYQGIVLSLGANRKLWGYEGPNAVLMEESCREFWVTATGILYDLQTDGDLWRFQIGGNGSWTQMDSGVASFSVDAAGNLNITYGPDLTAEVTRLYDPLKLPGSSLRLDTLVRNTGRGAAGRFAVRAYASLDETISADDYYLGSTWLNGLAANSLEAVAISGRVPDNIPGGTYHIGLIVDPLGEVLEVNEANNVVRYTAPWYTTSTLQVVEPGTTQLEVYSGYYFANAGSTLSVNGRRGVAESRSGPGIFVNVQLTAPAQYGVVHLLEDGAFTYTPNPGFTGEDTFWFRARTESTRFSEPTPVTIQVLAEPPLLCDPSERQVTIDDAIVTEGDSGEKYIDFTVRLSRPAVNLIQIYGQSYDGTARAGIDYLPTGDGNSSRWQVLFFGPGETTKALRVTVLPNADVSGDRNFCMDIYYWAPAGEGSTWMIDGQAVGTIRDDDQATDPAGLLRLPPGRPVIDNLPPDSVPAAPQAVSAALMNQTRGKQARLVARVQFTTGSSREIVSRFQKPRFQRITVALQDVNGDGLYDAVQFKARQGKKHVAQVVYL